MIIKVCGMKYADNIKALDILKPDMTGFIFHPSSPRFVKVLPDYMSSSSLRVGVFVNSDTDYILYKVKEFGLDMVQLHGSETPEQCHIIRHEGIDIIKAFSLKTDNADSITSPYEGLCRYYLLSGGIRPESLEQISSFRHPSFAGIDINSGFETAPGMKDTESIAKFIKQLRTL